jgi:hypothetical protein
MGVSQVSQGGGGFGSGGVVGVLLVCVLQLH